jgi:nucleoside-diphosphate-sugar epimerase
VAALWRGKSQRVYNINDDTELRMGDYFDVAADLYGLPRPPRLSREAAAEQLSPLRLSFMRESRRMSNRRMKRELRVGLRYPTVLTGLVS